MGDRYTYEITLRLQSFYIFLFFNSAFCVISFHYIRSRTATRDEDIETELGVATTSGLEIHKQNGIEVDDDGRPKRTGNKWTASAHIVTAVIGSGVLSLAWCVAQLGWIAGPVALFIFSFITYFTASLLADCYRSPDPVTGKRNYSYMQAVKNNLGGTRYMLCGLVQYINICGTAIGYTITAGISMAAVEKSNCFHKKGHKTPCLVSYSTYMIAYGIVEVILSQIPNIHKLSWLSSLAAVMSFCYAFIGVALSVAQIITEGVGRTSLGGVPVGPHMSPAKKVWKTFSALGDIAFAYSFAVILIEVQDTLRPPKENKQMKVATKIGVATTTVFYVLCGCLGYAAFGNDAPGNMLTGFGFYEPFWLIDFANVCIVVHLVGAYQVFCQTLFVAIETNAAKKWPKSKFITAQYTKYKFNLFRIVWRTCFVAVATLLAVALPFFNDILALLGAISYWPLTVYFPIEMYMAQKKLPRTNLRAIGLQLLQLGCFLVALAAACGSIEGITKALETARPFHTKQ